LIVALFKKALKAKPLRGALRAALAAFSNNALLILVATEKRLFNRTEKRLRPLSGQTIAPLLGAGAFRPRPAEHLYQPCVVLQ
jgi:hypothetical protein